MLNLPLLNGFLFYTNISTMSVTYLCMYKNINLSET